MGTEDGDGSRGILRSLNFFHDIFLEAFKVQLLLASNVEAKPSDFTLDFAFVSLAAVIFGSDGRRLHNSILLIQFGECL